MAGVVVSKLGGGQGLCWRGGGGAGAVLGREGVRARGSDIFSLQVSVRDWWLATWWWLVEAVIDRRR